MKFKYFNLIVLGFYDTSTHVVYLGKREIEKIVEETKETDRGEKGKRIKV